jgi:hypothetical protein
MTGTTSRLEFEVNKEDDFIRLYKELHVSKNAERREGRVLPKEWRESQQPDFRR